jgi:hypothetical protein
MLHRPRQFATAIFAIDRIVRSIGGRAGEKLAERTVRGEKNQTIE